eukprot:TRINITY_DN3506_c0_g2_i3.p1 TRINITY_DN3506_c0_g2~~TRINITY_DN3506_c0_g2_i3.p1  ORF type:complete len:358 (+),score=41.72 TRINITY_DN3506_c0_g2_i3:248-1321(+)
MDYLFLPIEVKPGLYIGGVQSLDKINEYGITHVISLLPDYAISRNWIDTSVLDGKKWWHINVEDADWVNLLQYFPDTCKFIEDALASDGKVLVHCFAGVSRSATIVLAYMMKKRKHDVFTALILLQSEKPDIGPNDGFMKQLHLWYDMDYKLDSTDENYKVFLLKNTKKDSVRQEEEINLDEVEENDETQQQQNGDSKEVAEQFEQQKLDQEGVIYKCKMCRSILATSSQVLDLNCESARKTFKYNRPTHYDPNNRPTSVYVQPMKWMQGISNGNISGKLYCYKCNTKVGQFNWSGLQSPSGSFVTPGFELLMKKVDAQQVNSQQSSSKMNDNNEDQFQLPIYTAQPHQLLVKERDT